MASHRCHCDTAFKEKSRRRQKSLGAVRRVENRCRSWPAQRREGLAKGGVSRSETSARQEENRHCGHRAKPAGARCRSACRGRRWKVICPWAMTCNSARQIGNADMPSAQTIHQKVSLRTTGSDNHDASTTSRDSRMHPRRAGVAPFRHPSEQNDCAEEGAVPAERPHSLPGWMTEELFLDWITLVWCQRPLARRSMLVLDAFHGPSRKA